MTKRVYKYNNVYVLFTIRIYTTMPVDGGKKTTEYQNRSSRKIRFQTPNPKIGKN